jgi:signal transduction histidine kinase
VSRPSRFGRPTGAGDDLPVPGIVGWHVAFWAIWSLSVVVVLAEPAWGPRTGGVTDLVLLAVLGLAYLVLGQPAARTRNRRQGLAYLIVMVAVLSALFAVSPGLSFLLFLAFPQVWFLAETRRDAIVLTVVLTASTGTVFLLAADSWTDARGSLVSIGVSLVFSLLLGLWISSVVDQSAERAALIGQLEAARADLARAHHDAGVVAERERLAREIHDTIAQGLTSVVMLSQVAARHLAGQRADDAAASVAAIEDAARQNLADARALVASYAAVGVAADLPAALRRLAERFQRETGVTVDVEVSGPDGPGSGRAHEVVLLRSVQEGLANVRKHARATHVTVVLSTGPDGRRTVEVRDDGVGFSPDSASGAGFGLEGLTRRAGEVGGRVAVDSAPGTGTVLRVEVPGG